MMMNRGFPLSHMLMEQEETSQQRSLIAFAHLMMNWL